MDSVPKVMCIDGEAEGGAVAEETKICPLCEKAIPVSKFRMHEMGCARANYKCKECGMCVPKEDKEEHEAEEHAIMTCPDCNFQAPKWKYGNHNEYCAMKPKVCEWCNQLIKVSDWQDHRSMCGIKTYQCPTCEMWVKFMDKATHVSSGGCKRN